MLLLRNYAACRGAWGATNPRCDRLLRGGATTAHDQRGRHGTWGERRRRFPSGDPVDARATGFRQADHEDPIEGSAAALESSRPNTRSDVGMTDTNDLRDSLRMPPRGRWTGARCAAPSSTAPTRKRTITSIKPSTKPPISPWQATPPTPLFRPARSAASSSTGPTKTRTAAVTGSCRRSSRSGDHPLPVGNGRLQGLLRRSGRWASRSQGTDIGHTLAQEVPQAFTEAVLNVDSY
jgi:hypothetical protein